MRFAASAAWGTAEAALAGELREVLAEVWSRSAWACIGRSAVNLTQPRALLAGRGPFETRSGVAFCATRAAMDCTTAAGTVRRRRVVDECGIAGERGRAR